MADTKWLTVAALIALAIATYLSWYWVWGILFVFWGAQSLQTGEAFLIEVLERERDPTLFWAVTAMWIGFGLWYVCGDLAWRLGT